MSYPEDLLEQAEHLARRERKKPKQASLRRAVSTAYYALFHLLVTDAAKNWKVASQRPLLQRAFEHNRMKTACENKRRELTARLRQPSPDDGGLNEVATTFARMQQHRHLADYDGSKDWTRTEVLNDVKSVADAFATWKSIRDGDLAQEFLVTLLVRER